MELNIQKEEYANKMRIDMSNEDIRLNNGQLNHKYFLCKKGQYWSDKYQEQLLKGIQEIGIGNWSQINTQFFEDKANEVELELRTCMLLSINDLQDYQGQQLDQEEIQKQKELNIQKAKQENKFKDNIYVKIQ